MSIRLKRRRFGQLMLLGSTTIAFRSLTEKVWAQTGNRLHSTTPFTVPVGTNIILRVNGIEHRLNLEPRVTLLDALREYIGLTGTKKGCNRGQCGACTLLVNGRRINSCLSLAVMHQEEEIITIEGLARGNELNPMQAAFINHDGFQCGYCTSGQICSAVAMLNEAATNTVSAVSEHITTDALIELNDAEIRERMSGNLCRCGAYPNIVAAIRDVHHQSA